MLKTVYCSIRIHAVKYYLIINIVAENFGIFAKYKYIVYTSIFGQISHVKILHIIVFLPKLKIKLLLINYYIFKMYS